ncbi:hypothetical protein K474DRAFT_1029265 [Panus rudis PR-1116 ss-1]|nr:hypothetical protein K474DRAFT_1029265 [Panus rudis PR-1116 ss-1]
MTSDIIRFFALAAIVSKICLYYVLRSHILDSFRHRRQIVKLIHSMPSAFKGRARLTSPKVLGLLFAMCFDVRGEHSTDFGFNIN